MSTFIFRPWGCSTSPTNFHVALSDGVHCVYCGEVYSTGFGGCILGSPRSRHEMDEVIWGIGLRDQYWRLLCPYSAYAPIGKDLLRAQWRWPVGMPLCRTLGKGLWEVRTDLPTKRMARMLLCLYREHLVALHGFIKKTHTTPDDDLALARKRQKELER